MSMGGRLTGFFCFVILLTKMEKWGCLRVNLKSLAFFCRRSRLRSLIGAFPDCNAFPLRERGGLDQSLVYLVRHKSQKLPRHMAEFSRMMHDAWEKIAEY